MKTHVLSLFLAATVTLPAWASDAQFKEQILNGQCCVPNLSHGYHPVILRNGHYALKDESVDLGQIVFGQLDGKPVAVAVMSNNTGGSGYFNSLMLYEQRGGKAVVIGSQGFGDRAKVDELRFHNGKIRLVSEEQIGPDHGKHTTVELARKDFDKAECLEAPLSGETKADVDALIKLWQSAGTDNFSDADKKTVLDICDRHKTDRASFARAFKLTLAEQGWLDPVSTDPLQFDASGNPVLYDDAGKKVREFSR